MILLFEYIQSWCMLWITSQVYLLPDSSSTEPRRISVTRVRARTLEPLIVVLGFELRFRVGVVCESETDRISIASLQTVLQLSTVEGFFLGKNRLLSKRERKKKVSNSSCQVVPKIITNVQQQRKQLILPFFFLKYLSPSVSSTLLSIILNVKKPKRKRASEFPKPELCYFWSHNAYFNVIISFCLQNCSPIRTPLFPLQTNSHSFTQLLSILSLSSPPVLLPLRAPTHTTTSFTSTSRLN